MSNLGHLGREMERERAREADRQRERGRQRWCSVVVPVHICFLLFYTEVKNGLTTSVSTHSDDGDGCYVAKRPHSMEMSTIAGSSRALRGEQPRSNTSEAKLEAKKRVIRMLVVIVVLFFLCWMPLYCVNTWRAFDDISAKQALSGAPIAFIHLLCYTSACVNPVIYCFMNTRFRKALLATFSCCGPLCHRHQRRGLQEKEEDVLATGASISKFSYTTVSTMGGCWSDSIRSNPGFYGGYRVQQYINFTYHCKSFHVGLWWRDQM